MWDWNVPSPKSLTCEVEEHLEKKKRESYMCCPVYFMNSVSSCRCRHSAITLNPCALMPSFPCHPPYQCITESSFQCRQTLKCCLLQKSSSADFPAMIWPCFWYRICWRECQAQIADTNSFAGALNPHRSSLLLLTWFNSLLLVLWEAAATPLPFLQALSKASFHSDLAHSSCSHVQSWVRINCNLIISWTIRCCINYSDSEIGRYKALQRLKRKWEL